MNTIDLFLSAPDRVSLESDLQAAGIIAAAADTLGDGSAPAAGVSLDFIGQLVDHPATFEPGTFPLVELTPATFLTGFRANVRLTGPLAAARAEAFVNGTHAGETVVLADADVPAAQRGRWGDEGFPWAPESLPTPPPDAPAPTIAQRRAQLLARLAERRWQVETGGIMLDGVPIRTDRESTAMLTAAVTFCNLESEAVVRWKAANGEFYELGETGLRAIALEVGRHVQACFAREAELSGEIHAAGTAEALADLAALVEAFSP